MAEFLFDTDLAALSLVIGKALTVYTCKDISLLIPCLAEDDETLTTPSGIVSKD